MRGPVTVEPERQTGVVLDPTSDVQLAGSGTVPIGRTFEGLVGALDTDDMRVAEPREDGS